MMTIYYNDGTGSIETGRIRGRRDSQLRDLSFLIDRLTSSSYTI